MANIRPLPADLQKVAIEQLNEVPERVAEDIQALKTWIEQQPYLRARTHDQFLLAFLRGSKFSLEKAKSKIDKYYTLRSKYPDFFTIQNLDDPRMLELIRMGIGLVLPTPLHENGPRLMLIRAGGFPSDKYTFNDVMCMANTMQEITLMEDDYAVVNGIIDILDMSQMTTGHFLQMTPTIMKKLSVFTEEAVPLRQKGSHFIKAPSAFYSIYKVLNALMPEKQQKRNVVHGDNLDTLYTYIPKKYLPIEYGGENGSIQKMIEEGLQKYYEYRDFFLEEKNYGTDEKLRPGESVDYDNIFGVEGSFRKLNVD